MSMFDSEVQERPAEAWLSLDSDFGAAKDDARACSRRSTVREACL